jgi:DNA-binding MarR family transcriptional regulator
MNCTHIRFLCTYLPAQRYDLPVIRSVQEDVSETEEPRADDALASEWHEALNRFHRTTCALDRALSSDHNITVSDFEVLQQLHEVTGCVRMQELANRVHLTQSALSRLITRLEKAGLVTRGTCEDDRRSVWTEITSAGNHCYLAARPTHRAILRELADADTDTGC